MHPTTVKQKPQAKQSKITKTQPEIYAVDRKMSGENKKF